MMSCFRPHLIITDEFREILITQKYGISNINFDQGPCRTRSDLSEPVENLLKQRSLSHLFCIYEPE